MKYRDTTKRARETTECAKCREEDYNRWDVTTRLINTGNTANNTQGRKTLRELNQNYR